MKARILPCWLFGLAGAAVTAVHVLAQVTPVPSTTTASEVPPAALTPNTGPPPPAVTAAPLPSAGAANLSPGPSAPLSAAASEIRSLTEAGVDQPVILAYITNSPRLFNLSPDNIIRLQRAGIPPQVISAMIRHDQRLVASGPPSPTPASPLVSPIAQSPALDEPQLVASTESSAGEYFDFDDGYSVAEQPASAGPVRMPYPVKLNDPIVILKLPTFTVPCW